MDVHGDNDSSDGFAPNLGEAAYSTSTAGTARERMLRRLSAESRRSLGCMSAIGSWYGRNEEILATFDANAQLDGLPFQPEMLAFCGKRTRVAKVAHKTCDTIKKTGGRRMDSAVPLKGARYDGAAHGGCQAA
jgi:hypothetical protein